MDIYIPVFLLLIISVLAGFLFRNKKHDDIVINELNQQIEKFRQELKVIDQIKIKAELDSKIKTAILMDVSHEIRGYMHGIMNLSNIISTKWEKIEDGDKRKGVADIFNSSFELVNTVNNLLDYTKHEAGKMVYDFKYINFVEYITKVAENYKKMYLMEDKIFLKLQTNEALIYGDSTRLEQVLRNLFANAVKYTKKTQITAELRLVNDGNKAYWKFILSDEGKGIPRDELEHIFEEFIQGTSNKGNKKIGSGLGLAMCKQIIDDHSGKIWAENNLEGPGAKFSFTIPALNLHETLAEQGNENE